MGINISNFVPPFESTTTRIAIIGRVIGVLLSNAKDSKSLQFYKESESLQNSQCAGPQSKMLKLDIGPPFFVQKLVWGFLV